MSQEVTMDDDLGGERAYMMDNGEDEGEDGLVDRYEIFMPVATTLTTALGGYEQVETSPGVTEAIYRPGDSVLGVLKDLKRLWRKDDTDDERTVARCFYQAGLMKELIALLIECTERGEWGRKISLVVCDLMAALTWPIDVAQELKELEDEPSVVTDYASLIRAHVEYKAMLLRDPACLRCFMLLVLPSVAKTSRDRNERDGRIISLILHLIRNLVSIKDVVASAEATAQKEEFSGLQSDLILQLDQTSFLDFILTVASNAERSDLNTHNVLVLDILHLIFRNVRAGELAKDQIQASSDNLAKLLDAERQKRKFAARASGSRHSRFGTTISVRKDDSRYVLHKQAAIGANAADVIDGVKRKRATRAKKVDDLTTRATLTPKALTALQKMAKSFVESCFNPFFASVFKDIRMERSKIREADNLRALFVARFFTEFFLALRAKEEPERQSRLVEAGTRYKELEAKRAEAAAARERLWEEADPEAEAEAESVLPADGVAAWGMSFSLVAEVLEEGPVRWAANRMRLTMEDQPPAWTELQASLEYLTQLLLLIDVMSLSKETEATETSEALQDRLYYNGELLDSSIEVLIKYKDQSIAYLDSVIHFAYVLLRMLEKYSKNKAYMYVRKKRAKKQKELDGEVNPDVVDSDGEGHVRDQGPSYADHSFTFSTFERRFAQSNVVKTLLYYLSRYRDFDDPAQLKRVVGLMHRQIVKVKAEGLYFQVSTLDLFRHILDDQAALARNDNSKDLISLITYVLRKFFKQVSENPMRIVEAFFPKSGSKWKEFSSYVPDDEPAAKKAASRVPAELEFKKDKQLSWSQQMGVVVSCLKVKGHAALIEWLQDVIAEIIAARDEVVLSVDGTEDALSEDDEDAPSQRRLGPSADAIAKFAEYILEPSTDEQKEGVHRNQHFRLMLKLVAFEGTLNEETAETQWSLPVNVIPQDLKASLGAIESFIRSPVDINGEDPSTMLKAQRRKPAPRKKRQASGSEDDRPRRKRKEKERQVYKSAAFIEDSDTDEEADRAFFAREAALAEANDVRAKAGGHSMLKTGTKRKKGGKKGSKAKVALSSQANETQADQSQDGQSTPTMSEDEMAPAANRAPRDAEASEVSDTSDVERVRGSRKTLRLSTSPESD